MHSFFNSIIVQQLKAVLSKMSIQAFIALCSMLLPPYYACSTLYCHNRVKPTSYHTVAIAIQRVHLQHKIPSLFRVCGSRGICTLLAWGSSHHLAGIFSAFSSFSKFMKILIPCFTGFGLLAGLQWDSEIENKYIDQLHSLRSSFICITENSYKKKYTHIN